MIVRDASWKTGVETAWRRLRRNRAAVVGSTLVTGLAIIAIFAHLISPYNPVRHNYDKLLSPPSLTHFFGTDQYGRDVFSRVLFGCRYALLIGGAVVVIQMLIGVTLGLIAGYYGGITQTLIMRLTDVMLSIPSVVLAVTIAGFLGGGIQNAIIALGVVGWRGYTRLVQAKVLSIKEQPYMEAARAISASSLRILLRHILPNVLAPVVVYATLSAAAAILWAAALSFLGLGAQPPTPEWGAMLADGRNFLIDAWWIATFPGLATMLMIVSFNFLGDGLRDALDPRMERR